MTKKTEKDGQTPDNEKSMKQSIHELESDLSDSQDIFNAIKNPVLVLDADLRVITANRAYQNTFKTTIGATEGKLLVELGGGQWDIPELTKLLEEILETDSAFQDFEVDRSFDPMGRRIMLLDARRILREPGKAHRVLLTIEDATRSRMLKNVIEESEAFHRALLNNITDAVFLTDDAGRFVYVCGNVRDIFGKSAEEMEKTGSIEAILGKDLFDGKTLDQSGEIANIEREITDASGKTRVLLVSVKRTALRGGTLLYTCRDYTEGKRQERKLAATMAKLSAIYAHAPIAMMLVDRERRIVEVNGFAARFAGRSAQEMIGLRGGEALRCLHHLDDPPGCGFGPACNECKVRLAVVETFADKKTRENIEAWLPFPKNGGSEARCLQVSTSYLAFDGEEQVLVCVQDITEKKQRMDKLQEARDAAVVREKEINGLLTASRAVHELAEFETAARKVFDAAKQLLGANSGYVALLSETGQENEVVFLDSGGLPCDVDPDLPMPVRGLRAEAYRTGRAVFENDFAHSPWMRFMPKGHVRLSNVLFAPLMLEKKAVGLLGLANKQGGFTRRDAELASSFADLAAVALKNARDLTMREKAEQSLRESERRYREFFDNPLTGVAVYEAAGGGEDFVFREFNRAAEKMTGRTRVEVVGKKVTEVFPGFRGTGLLDVFRKVHRTGEAQHHPPGRYVFPDGTVRWYENHVHRLPSGEIVALFVDETKRMEAEAKRARIEEQLHQTQKLESVGRLAGGVAHDFNNMLSVIIGYAENLRDRLHPNDPMREDVEEILQAGKRSAHLTRQLLAFSRKQTLQPRVLDINALVRDLAKMLGRLIGEDIDLKLLLSEKMSRVMVDPGQMEQVIINLAVNARDAMPRGGKLTIETAYVMLDEEYARTHVGVVQGNYVMLAVTDTGCGMDRETLARVFEPFFSTKERGKGTGLGLSTVYGIVKQSGGNVWVYSEPGLGTTFKIYLPRTDAEMETETREKETARGGGEHILVVEDEESVRKLMGTVLPKAGYRVSLAANGGEALLLVEKKGVTPDLLITDVVMPNMSGRELVERLKKSLPELRVLYMSGYTDNVIVHHGILDPDTAFIQKPFTIKNLVHKIQEVLLRK